MFGSLIRWVLILLSVGCLRLAAEDLATPMPPQGGHTSFDPWIDVYTKVAATYDFRLQESPDEKLEFHPRPVQIYSHPSGLQGTHGAFFIWTRGTRPVVVGSIWSYEVADARRNLAHEFDSLAESALVETKVGGATWAPRTVIQPEAIPDAPVPSSVSRLRLAQIRQLAKQFTGYSTNTGEPVRLRLLPQPLYYAKSSGVDVTDSALFCLFADWDPEIILLIEARATEDGPRWHYSAARFNVCPMWLEYQGERIWNQTQAPQTTYTFGDPTGPFFAVHEPDALPATLDEDEGTPKTE